MLESLTRRGIQRGLIGGSRAWLWVGVGAGTLRLLRRLMAEEPEVLWRAAVEPGEKLVIKVREPGDEATGTSR